MKAPKTGQAGEGRIWGGRSAGERRAERLVRLTEAGIELFGTRGYARTSVKAICTEAGLTERYFYEAFDDREDLLAAIFANLVSYTQERTLAAIAGAPDSLFERLDVGLEAFFEALTADPRRARIQEIETVGVSPGMESRRREAFHSYAAIIADQVRRDPGFDTGSEMRLDVIALGVVGAVNEQMIDFVLGELDISAAELLSHQKMMLASIVRPLVGF